MVVTGGIEGDAGGASARAAQACRQHTCRCTGTCLPGSVSIRRQCRDLAALHHLPVLTKELIRTHFEELRADDAQHVAMFSTTGSSSRPLRFLIGRRRVSSRDVAAKWRATRWWDVNIGDREIVAWSSPHRAWSPRPCARGLARSPVAHAARTPAIALTPARLDAFVGEILDFRPRMLAIRRRWRWWRSMRAPRACRWIERGIQVAFVTAERLYPHQRDAIEQVFGCRVANGYGGHDAGFSGTSRHHRPRT